MDKYSISVFKRGGNCETMMAINFKTMLFFHLKWLKSKNRKDYSYGHATKIKEVSYAKQ